MRRIDPDSGAGTPPNIPQSPLPLGPAGLHGRMLPAQQTLPSFPAHDANNPALSIPGSVEAAYNYPALASNLHYISPTSARPASDLRPQNRPLAPVPAQSNHGSDTSNEDASESTTDQVVGSQGRRGIIPHESGFEPAVPMNEFMTMTHEKNPDGKYPCPSCHKTYQNSKHLTRHYYSHSKDRPYKCRLCDTIFTRSDVLKRHFNKCADRRNIPISQRGSHLQHSTGYSKKHGRLRRDDSLVDGDKNRSPGSSDPSSALPSPTILRSNHTRDNSGVTDGSFASPSITTNSSRRHSLTYDEVTQSPMTYSAANGLENLNIGYASPPILASPQHYQAQPHGLLYDPTRPDAAYSSQQYYSQPQQQWQYTTAGEANSMAAFYPPSSVDPSVVNNPTYAYSHIGMTPGYQQPMQAQHPQMKHEDHEMYEMRGTEW